MKQILLPLAIVAGLSAPHGIVLAQAPPKPETTKTEPSKPAVTPLRLLITVSRYQGDKKISSLPYSFSTSVGGPRIGFNIGAQVPYATTPSTDNAKTPAYSYRDIGIKIVISGQTMVEPGQYKMEVAVEDSTLSSSSQVQPAPAVPGVPIFRNFNTLGTVLLRDGQTTQLTTAGDPITGETTRVDVMLTVIK